MNTFSASGVILRNDVFNNVNGKNCHSELNGVFAPTEKQHFDNHTTINHFVADCKSFENYKGVIKESGVGVFNGKVIVADGAQQTDSNQSNKNLLLSQNATAHSNPQLEIYADDVKCGHGSTTGALDKDSIFYLRARGIKESDANNILVKAFAKEILQDFVNDDIRNLSENNLNHWIDG